MNATEQYVSKVQSVIPYKVVLQCIFVTVDEILKCDYFNESY